jgi:hypothetical protein
LLQLATTVCGTPAAQVGYVSVFEDGLYGDECRHLAVRVLGGRRQRALAEVRALPSVAPATASSRPAGCSNSADRSSSNRRTH